MHTEGLVKSYHRRHPLDSNKKAPRRGTRKLIRALLTPTSSLSPTDKIRSWLLGNAPRKLPLRTPIVPPLGNKHSPPLPTFLWPSTPSDLFKKGSLGRVRTTPGNLCNGLPSSCGLMFAGGEVKGSNVPSPWDTLARVIHQVSFLKTLLCPTPPSERGRPL